MPRTFFKEMRQRERSKLLSILRAVNGGEPWRRHMADERKEMAALRARWRKPRAFRGHTVQLIRAEVAGPSVKDLRRLVNTWWQAGCDLERWSDTNWELYVAVNRALRTFVYNLGIVPNGRSFLGPLSLPRFDPKVSSGFRHAAWQFTGLATSPLRKDLGKCDRCGKYYLNTSGHRNKRYCSRNCTRLGSALEAMRKRRHQERQDKLRLVRAALRDLVPTRHSDPKQWIAERAGVTKKWLTRAINRGELKAPEVRRGEPASQTAI